MNRKNIIFKALMLSGMMMVGGSAVEGQSTPSPVNDCQQYQWPATLSPCPEVQIKQKHDHTPSAYYRRQGWDTVVTCTQRQLVLSCTPYVPVQYFDGMYYVDEIPYNPADTSFSLGTRMPPMADDSYAPTFTSIPFPFYFFGLRKEQFRFGANGLITFCPPATFGSGDHCPFSISAGDQFPWTPSANNHPGHSADEFNRTHDAICGVFEDTDPSITTGHSRTDWGMYYGIQGEYPCQKIICSWNDMSQFSCNSMHCTYQIVCYEGSNIIEVHVKQREVCTSWQGGRGYIGIQNATGLPQTKGAIGSTTMHVAAGSPSAFWPVGRNNYTSSQNNVAYRFTPRGQTLVMSEWYRILDDGRDTVLSTSESAGDTNGYFVPLGSDTTLCNNLTLAYVSPTTTSRYVFHMKFRNANNDWYNLYDTITIGVDTVRDLSFSETEQYRCVGQQAQTVLSYPSTQSVQRLAWTLNRKVGDELEELSTDLLDISPEQDDGTNKHITVMMPTGNIPGAPRNKIDTLIIQASVDFTSGCNNFVTTMVRVYPNFDTTVVDGICRGETYVWDTRDSYDGCHYTHSYKDNTDPATTSVALHSQPGCDSTVRLALTVYDVSFTVDDTTDCKPIRWQNGKTYTQTNTATAALDTVVLPNRYGCDSVVQLQFTMHPLKAMMRTSLESFDLDHLDVVLTDVSTGGGERVWRCPGAADQTGAQAYYSIPVELSEADLWLIEYSPYGCVDSTHKVLPLNKETFWVPNAFTPDNPAGNNLFGSVSSKTVQQEMYIYDRFGTQVFHCEGVDCKWDGRNEQGEKCLQGAYVYLIRYTNSFEPDKTHVLRGTVTLIR